jgi:hypothetical protein
MDESEGDSATRPPPSHMQIIRGGGADHALAKTALLQKRRLRSLAGAGRKHRRLIQTGWANRQTDRAATKIAARPKT